MIKRIIATLIAICTPSRRLNYLKGVKMSNKYGSVLFKAILPIVLNIIIFSSTLLATNPPHPNLLKKIRAGEIKKTYFLANKESLMERGISMPWRAPGNTRSQFGLALVPTGSTNALAIVVDFSDNTYQVASTYFDSLLFASGVVSLRDYFNDVSYGNLDIVTVNLPSALGWQRADSAYSYYVDGQNGFGSWPKNAQKLVEEIVQVVDASVDFSLYDNDSDGYVDALFIIHAGPGAEFTNSNDDIWSHAWVTSIPQSLDGVLVWRYSMEPEYWDTPGDMTIGVYAHELGHALFGLPDLYDTDNSSGGLGRWSLMAGGSWNGVLGGTPAFPDAWSHIEMGYVTTTDIAVNDSDVVIANVEDSALVFRLWTDGVGGNEYFLVENRQPVSYDAALPGDGLLIYHVDDAVATVSNNDEWYPGFTSSGHYRVALEQADGLWELEIPVGNFGDNGDPYPGVTGNISFDFFSTPNSDDYSSDISKVAVTNISASGNLMTADFSVSFDDFVPIDPPVITSIDDVPNDQGGWVTVSWNASLDDNSLSSTPVVSYSIWLRNDVPASSSFNKNEVLIKAMDETSNIITFPIIQKNVAHSMKLGGNTNDHEEWIGIGSIDAIQDSQYKFLIHTLEDSNSTGINYSVIRVSAHPVNPLNHAFSQSDSSYSVDNLKPSAPAAVAAGMGAEGLVLNWSPIADEDFDFYAIYRNEVSGFDPSLQDYFATTTDSFYVDSDIFEGTAYYYRLTSFDFNGNESDFTSEISSGIVGIDGERFGIPTEYALAQNYPNPFNPVTSINYSLPNPGKVSLVIYDLNGQVVMRWDDETVQAGYFQKSWNGTNITGNKVSSGVYLYRLIAGDFVRSRKMLLLK